MTDTDHSHLHESPRQALSYPHFTREETEAAEAAQSAQDSRLTGRGSTGSAQASVAGVHAPTQKASPAYLGARPSQVPGQQAGQALGWGGNWGRQRPPLQGDLAQFFCTSLLLGGGMTESCLGMNCCQSLWRIKMITRVGPLGVADNQKVPAFYNSWKSCQALPFFHFFLSFYRRTMERLILWENNKPNCLPGILFIYILLICNVIYNFLWAH